MNAKAAGCPRSSRPLRRTSSAPRGSSAASPRGSPSTPSAGRGGRRASAVTRLTSMLFLNAVAVRLVEERPDVVERVAAVVRLERTDAGRSRPGAAGTPSRRRGTAPRRARRANALLSRPAGAGRERSSCEAVALRVLRADLLRPLRGDRGTRLRRSAPGSRTSPSSTRPAFGSALISAFGTTLRATMSVNSAGCE